MVPARWWFSPPKIVVIVHRAGVTASGLQGNGQSGLAFRDAGFGI